MKTSRKIICINSFSVLFNNKHDNLQRDNFMHTFSKRCPSPLITLVPLPSGKSCSAKTGSDKRLYRRRRLRRARPFLHFIIPPRRLSRAAQTRFLSPPDPPPAAPRPSVSSVIKSIHPTIPPPRAPASSSSLSPVALLHGPPPACLPSACSPPANQPACRLSSLN